MKKIIVFGATGNIGAYFIDYCKTRFQDEYEIIADVKEIKKLIGELGKIGSNLNQIARYFNQGGIISSEMRTEIKKSIRDIYEMKYEVMKMAGDFRGSN